MKGEAFENMPWIGVRSDWHTMADVDLQSAFVRLSQDHLRKHALLIGATGSGKTTLLLHLVAQDILLGHSLVVLDLRGDLVRGVLQLCQGNVEPSKILLLDLSADSPSFGFNPLVGPGEPYFRALNVLEVIRGEAESWGVRLEETLRNALLLFAEIGESLIRLEHLFYDRKFRLSCLGSSRCVELQSYWGRFDELSRDQQATLAAPVVNKVSLLCSTAKLRAILDPGTPRDLGDHLNRPGSILLASLAVHEMHGAGRMLGRLLLAALTREMFSRIAVSQERRNPVRLYLDEFEHFGDYHFEEILAEGRRFGLSLVLAHQTLAQISPRLRSLILNNVATKFVFRSGRDDAATLSKDLAGDPKALDIANLRTGHAFYWSAGCDPFPIEVNEPLLTDQSESIQARLQLLSQIPDDLAPKGSNSHESRENAQAKIFARPLRDLLCE